MYKTLHKKQGSVTVQLRFARSSVTFCAKRDNYPLAFGALGLAGFFNKKKWGLQIGYVIGVFGRFIFSTISGIVFFASYAPEGMNPILYSLGYQASYLVPEAVITLIIISIPPVAKALAHVKQNAVEA